MPRMKIELATLSDWPEIERIYRLGIQTKNATFTSEAEIPATGADWFGGKHAHLTFKAIDTDGVMLGWACLSPTSKRDVYRGVAEDSVYVDPAASGRGVGNALLEYLVAESEKAGIWTIVASIFPENEVSIYLHQKHGFKIQCRRDRIAQQDGIWRDTIYMERRSEVV